MGERYVIPAPAAVDREFRLTHPWWKFSASYNVAPLRNVPVIRLHQGDSEGVMMRWGLIPDWAEGNTSAASATHAPVADLERSAVLRGAWSRGQRCIMPAAGFYTWQLTSGGYRQPYFVRLVNRMVFGFAALWEKSVNKDDDYVIESCALITVPPNALMADVSSTAEQMPAIVDHRDYEAWLNASVADAKGLLRTYPQERMLAHPVSPRLNSLEHDDEGLVRAVNVKS